MACVRGLGPSNKRGFKSRGTTYWKRIEKLSLDEVSVQRSLLDLYEMHARILRELGSVIVRAWIYQDTNQNYGDSN